METVMEMVTINTTIQTIVPDDFRGRVMALYSLAFFGLMPFGALVLGIIAERIGTANALILSSLAGGLLGGIILLRWPQVIRKAGLPSSLNPAAEPTVEKSATGSLGATAVK